MAILDLMYKLSIVVLLLAGCVGGTYDRVPGQDRAEQIVWHDLYGETGDPPPVEWFPDDGGYLPGWKVQCGIEHIISPPDLYMPGPGFDCAISGSSFTHELMHYRTFLRTGDVDASHSRGDWDLADNQAFYALVSQKL